MNANVLVLNQDYQPLSICSVQRSMKLLFLDKAELLHDDPEKELRTPRDAYQFPSVIRLRSYIRIPYTKVVLSRRNIMRRDNFTCQYCGKKSDLTIDHGTISQTNEDEIKVHFPAGREAITPGQAVVCYEGNDVVAGGWIKKVNVGFEDLVTA